MNIQLQKVQLGFLVFCFCLVANVRLKIGIFNADSRKSVSKFSGFWWFLLFEDSYHIIPCREGYLQANETSKKH